MRVLVAGDRGYIGSVLTPLLWRPVTTLWGWTPVVRRLRLRAAAGRLRVPHR